MATKTGLTTMDAVVKLMEFNKLYNTIVTTSVNEKNNLTHWVLILNSVKQNSLVCLQNR